MGMVLDEHAGAGASRCGWLMERNGESHAHDLGTLRGKDAWAGGKINVVDLIERVVEMGEPCGGEASKFGAHHHQRLEGGCI